MYGKYIKTKFSNDIKMYLIGICIGIFGIYAITSTCKAQQIQKTSNLTEISGTVQCVESSSFRGSFYDIILETQSGDVTLNIMGDEEAKFLNHQGLKVKVFYDSNYRIQKTELIE